MPPVTALRSPPLSRITGALSPVIALSSTDATPSTTSPSHGMTSPAVHEHVRRRAQRGTPSTVSMTRRSRRIRQLLRHADRVRARAHRVRLRLAATLGHRLGEVREQQREPQPYGDDPRMNPAGASPCPTSGLTPSTVVRHAARPAPRTSPGCGAAGAGRACRTASSAAPAHDRRVEQRARAAGAGSRLDPRHGEVLRRSGRAPARGMKVSAPTTSTVATSSTTNSGVWVGSVPGPGGTCFLAASEPAMASAGTASQ